MLLEEGGPSNFEFNHKIAKIQSRIILVNIQIFLIVIIYA